MPQSIRQIALTCALLLAAGATAAAWDFYDPYGLQVHKHPWGSNGPVFTYPNVPRYVGILNGEPLNPRVARRPSSNTSSRTSRFDDLNLSVNMPNGIWVKLDPKKSGSRACFMISRRNPMIVISLAGERVGTEAGATNNSLLAESQAKMKALPGGTIEPGERQLSANGIQGVAYEASSAQDGTTAHYSIWLAAHHGYNYRLAVYGDQKDKTAIDEAMHSFLGGIKQIEPRKIARSDSNRKTR